jgi:hypothetical protein
MRAKRAAVVGTRIATAVALAALIAVAATTASAAPQAKTKICGQIKHGPHATYTSLLTKKRLSGNTWTVFATGVPCSVALRAAPKILKWFARAKIGASDYDAGGFACNKESDGRGSSGSVGCSYAKGSLANIELIMTGSYTIAQLKKLFFITP